MSILFKNYQKKKILECLRWPIMIQDWFWIISDQLQGQLWENYFFVYHMILFTGPGYLQIMSNGCHMSVTWYIFALNKERDLLLLHFITLMSRWRSYHRYPSFLFLNQTRIFSCMPVSFKIPYRLKTILKDIL